MNDWRALTNINSSLQLRRSEQRSKHGLEKLLPQIKISLFQQQNYWFLENNLEVALKTA